MCPNARTIITVGKHTIRHCANGSALDISFLRLDSKIVLGLAGFTLIEQVVGVRVMQVVILSLGGLTDFQLATCSNIRHC